MKTENSTEVKKDSISVTYFKHNLSMIEKVSDKVGKAKVADAIDLLEQLISNRERQFLHIDNSDELHPLFSRSNSIKLDLIRLISEF